MENYIVRIYQRDPADPLKTVGMVEVVETSETKAFRHVGELVDILCSEGNLSALKAEERGSAFKEMYQIETKEMLQR